MPSVSSASSTSSWPGRRPASARQAASSSLPDAAAIGSERAGALPRAVEVIEVDLAGVAVDPAIAGPVALRVVEVDPAGALVDRRGAGAVRPFVEQIDARLRRHRGCEAQSEEER